MKEALQGVPRVVIMPHNDPDPDAVATAVGLQYLLEAHFDVETQIGYQGIIGRAENTYSFENLREVSCELRIGETVIAGAILQLFRA